MGILHKKWLKKTAYPVLLPTRRDIKFNLPTDKIMNWHTDAGDIFTALLNTFSIVLPVGERFFIDAVRAHRNMVTDPDLQKAVTAFIGQEAMHGREHEEYNDALFARSPIAPKFEQLVSDIFVLLKKYLPPHMWLSGTIALEHFTALLADSLLTEPRLFEGADPDFEAIWRWHALEETEHKAVAFDVWDTVKGRGLVAYGERSLGLVIATVLFWGLVIPTFLIMLKDERKLTDLKGWRKFYRYTFGDIGALRIQLINYIDYFRPNFHPWDHDNRRCLEQINNLYK